MSDKSKEVSMRSVKEQPSSFGFGDERVSIIDFTGKSEWPIRLGGDNSENLALTLNETKQLISNLQAAVNVLELVND